MFFSDQYSLSPQSSRLAMLCLSIALTACGGGSSSEPLIASQSSNSTGGSSSTATDSTSSSTSTSEAAASLANCFQLTPGVKYLTSNGAQHEIELGQFDGRTAYKRKYKAADKSYFSESYTVVTDSYTENIGGPTLDSQGVVTGTVTSTGWRYPFNLAPGESALFQATTTTTTLNPPSSITTQGVEHKVTFFGYEDLMLDGRVFRNTCKIKIEAATQFPNSSPRPSVEWHAKGFGTIRYEYQDGDGNVLMSYQLQKVLAAP